MKGMADWRGADLVFFDCDSTLSAVEGIDELAERRGVDVSAATAAAMAGEVPLDAIYAERIRLVAPTAEDLDWLVGRYRATAVPGAAEVVAALGQLGIQARVLSGGLFPAVAPFAFELGFPEDSVDAVPYDSSDPSGAESSAKHPLARRGGKTEVVRETCGRLGVNPERTLLVGDGASDLEAAEIVGLFAGFGGVVERPGIREAAGVFLDGPGLEAVALLAAGLSRQEDLASVDPVLLQYAFSGLPPLAHTPPPA